MTWLRAQARAAAASYDLDKAIAGSHPTGVVMAAGAQGAVLATVGYLPAIASRAQIERPWIPLVLTAFAGLTTVLAWRHRCQGPVGVSATLLDNALYSAALTYAAAHATEGWGIGLGVVHGLMVLGFGAQIYALTLAYALVMAGPLVAVLATSQPPATVILVLVSTYVMVLVMSFMTGQRQRLMRERERLAEAVDATRRVADDSVQLALTSTLLSLGHFLHELRNGQTILRGNLDFIASSSALKGAEREALQDSIEAQEQQEQLVLETIQRMKAREPSEQEPWAAMPVIASAAEGATIEGEGEVQLEGDPEHLRVVLTNLIRNARQAGARHVWLRLELDAGALVLAVHDDGPGLPEDGRDDLFMPLTTSGKPSGTGLGLYLCRRYVELLGGRIDVRDSPEGGAAFVIRLPCT